MRKDIVEFCHMVGADPLLVQGAGGNVSWKDGDTIWIKASGTWLAEAEKKDIFVPVDLIHLKGALAAGDFGVKPKVRGSTELRPSIETLLHALMPQQVVVHLHAVEVLAHLVRGDCENSLGNLLKGMTGWVSVPYHKPGAALAQAVAGALKHSTGVNAVFLQNHGVVIGGADITAVEQMLLDLTARLATQANVGGVEAKDSSQVVIEDTLQYALIEDAGAQQLALVDSLFNLLDEKWVLYPDHVVFLGPKAICYEDMGSFINEIHHENESPELAFIRGSGVYARLGFSIAKQAQLRCYYDVLVRQPIMEELRPLSSEQVAELLDWDAEKYRMKMAE
jgi:rhamnose utilization protein RhaD (predicted bifunctional aldolase and dehydrogenase)